MNTTNNPPFRVWTNGADYAVARTERDAARNIVEFYNDPDLQPYAVALEAVSDEVFVYGHPAREVAARCAGFLTREAVAAAFAPENSARGHAARLDAEYSALQAIRSAVALPYKETPVSSAEALEALAARRGGDIGEALAGVARVWRDYAEMHEALARTLNDHTKTLAHLRAVENALATERRDRTRAATEHAMAARQLHEAGERLADVKRSTDTCLDALERERSAHAATARERDDAGQLAHALKTERDALAARVAELTAAQSALRAIHSAVVPLCDVMPSEAVETLDKLAVEHGGSVGQTLAGVARLWRSLDDILVRLNNERRTSSANQDVLERERASHAATRRVQEEQHASKVLVLRELDMVQARCVDLRHESDALAARVAELTTADRAPLSREMADRVERATRNRVAAFLRWIAEGYRARAARNGEGAQDDQCAANVLGDAALAVEKGIDDQDGTSLLILQRILDEDKGA